MMEFFERAHVAKNKQTLKKENKTEEATKKQLKQMLYGYKQSNNELIKKYANTDRDFDDSSSVSGFSDLNITNSSNEADSTNNTRSSNRSDINFQSLSLSPDIVNVDNIDGSNVTESNTGSISEDIYSAEETTNYEDTESSHEDSSISSYSSETSKSNSSDTFDANGLLASKILEKIKLLDKDHVIKKRKVNVENASFLTDNNTKSNMKRPGIMEVNDSDKNTSRVDQQEILKNERKCSSQFFSDTSSNFVSIEASNAPLQNFSDVIGGYKYSTVTHIPSDNIFSNNNSGMFCTENMDSVVINTHDDSLITKGHVQESILDATDTIPSDTDNITEDNLTMDNLNMSNPHMNISIEENTSICNDSVQSGDINSSPDSIDVSFVNPVKIFYIKKSCIFVFKHPTEMYIHGKVKIKALGGTMEISGYTLQNEPCEVFAPNYNCAQCLKTVKNQNAYYGLFGKLTSAGLTVADAEEIVTTLGEYDGVIQLYPLKKTTIDFIENNFKGTDLFRPNKNIDNIFRQASSVLGCSLYLSKPWKFYEISPSWNQVLKCGQSEQSRGIVCGGKGTGKSTFLRYYVNRLLGTGPVLVIDLDPGQAEFTVAGNISATVVTKPLLGPSFTHLQKPEIMLNLGMINTMDNPKRYAAAVNALITYCSTQEQLQNMQWIVNTMGMCNTMGLKFITLIIMHIKPTFLLQIYSRNPKRMFEHELDSHTVANLIQDYQNDKLFKNIRFEGLDYKLITSEHIESSGRKNFALPPRDERYLNFLAYFGELNTQEGGLLHITPYEVNINDFNIGVNVRIQEDAIFKVINGKVVALCQHTADNTGEMFNLSDKPLLCHGHGLIRGVDEERKLLYILSPVSNDILSLVNTLVYADWVPELRGLEKSLPKGIAIPYRTSTQYQQRQLMFAPRRRFNPLQLLKMSRSF